jgi:hypothetical protein
MLNPNFLLSVEQVFGGDYATRCRLGRLRRSYVAFPFFGHESASTVELARMGAALIGVQ